MIETNRELRGHRFYPTAAELAKMPKIYDQDGAGKQAIVHVHYFTANADWWITEFSPDFAENGEAFGYVRFASMPDCAELGYIYLPEVEELKVTTRGFPIYAERDLYWTPKPLAECI